MSGKYALVFWNKSKQLQTLESTCIPPHSRYENATVKLKWKSGKNPKSIKVLDAKILKIGDDKRILDNICVDETTGEIIDPRTKAFLGTVLKERSKLKTEKRKRNQQKVLAQVHQETVISNEKSIFEIYPWKKFKTTLSDTKSMSQGKKSSFVRKAVEKTSPVGDYAVSEGVSQIFKYRSDDDSEEDINASGNNSAKSDLKNLDEPESTEDEEIFPVDDDEPASFNVFFIPNVTPELVANQKLLLSSMEYSLKINQSKALREISKITKEIFQNKPDKAEIFPDSGCYFNKVLMTAVQLSNTNWRGLTNELFVQIYGQNLKYMSIKGHLGHISINKILLSAIYEYAKTIDSQIQWNTYKKSVNKLCTNRRRNIQMVKDGTNTDEPDQNVIDNVTTITKPKMNNIKIIHPSEALEIQRKHQHELQKQHQHQKNVQQGQQQNKMLQETDKFQKQQQQLLQQQKIGDEQPQKHHSLQQQKTGNHKLQQLQQNGQQMQQQDTGDQQPQQLQQLDTGDQQPQQLQQNGEQLQQDTGKQQPQQLQQNGQQLQQKDTGEQQPQKLQQNEQQLQQQQLFETQRYQWFLANERQIMSQYYSQNHQYQYDPYKVHYYNIDHSENNYNDYEKKTFLEM